MVSGVPRGTGDPNRQTTGLSPGMAISGTSGPKGSKWKRQPLAPVRLSGAHAVIEQLQASPQPVDPETVQHEQGSESRRG